MTRNYQLNESQISALRSLHFWRRNLYVVSIHQDLVECIKSKKTIVYAFKSCDQLHIPFSIQNRVIYTASQNTAFGDLKISGQKGNLLNHSTYLDTLNSMLNDSTIGGSSNEKSDFGNPGEMPES